MTRDYGFISPNGGPWTPADRELARRFKLREGAPDPDERPRPSVFPMTPAARAALELDGKRRRRK